MNPNASHPTKICQWFNCHFTLIKTQLHVQTCFFCHPLSMTFPKQSSWLLTHCQSSCNLVVNPTTFSSCITHSLIQTLIACHVTFHHKLIQCTTHNTHLHFPTPSILWLILICIIICCHEQTHHFNCFPLPCCHHLLNSWHTEVYRNSEHVHSHLLSSISYHPCPFSLTWVTQQISSLI